MTSSCTATHAALIFSVLVFGLVIRKIFYPVYFDTLQNLHRRSAFIASFDDLEQNMTKTSVSFIYKSCDKKPRQLCREHGIDQLFFPNFSIHLAQITNHVEFYGFFFFYRIHVWGRNNKYFPMLLDPKIWSHVLCQWHVRSYIGWLRWGDVKSIPTPLIVL
jgi:hypothetical protein